MATAPPALMWQLIKVRARDQGALAAGARPKIHRAIALLRNLKATRPVHMCLAILALDAGRTFVAIAGRRRVSREEGGEKRGRLLHRSLPSILPARERGVP